MEKFGFLIHPLDVTDIYRKFSLARYLPVSVLENLFKRLPPFKVSHITGVSSSYGQAEGWFVTCPLTAKQMLTLPPQYVMEKIIKAGKVAEKLGAKIIGLGAFTSVVGDGGYTVAQNMNVAVTTGNSLTVATALEGAKNAAKRMGHDLKNVHVVVVGATGSIGRVCSMMLASQVNKITLVARNKRSLEDLANKIMYQTGMSVGITSNVKEALKTAHIVITVTSAVDTIIGPDDLMPGTIVCDVSRPRNVSKQVALERNDVLVIEGGVVEVPGDIQFNFNFGFPPGMAYACMAETMILALEGKYENFSLGKELTIEQVETIWSLAQKHGFKMAGFRSFEKAITDEEFEKVKKNAMTKGLKIC